MNFGKNNSKKLQEFKPPNLPRCTYVTSTTILISRKENNLNSLVNHTIDVCNV